MKKMLFWSAIRRIKKSAMVESRVPRSTPIRSQHPKTAHELLHLDCGHR